MDGNIESAKINFIELFRSIDNSDLDEHLDKIKDIVNQKDERIEQLIFENNKLRDIHYKDYELIKLKEENERLQNELHKSFTMSGKEFKDYKEFANLHYSLHKGETKLITYGTGIGLCWTCKCTVCNKEKNITDIGSW
jgi:hypothetical protein